MAKTRRAYTGGAASTTTTSAIASSGTTSFTITAYTGWPYGADPFFVVVEPGTANEEKMLVVRSGSTDTTLTVYPTPSVAANRGMDGTSAVAHSSGATIYPVFTALDADEANELASTLTTKGDILAHDASSFTRLAVGTDGRALVADSGEATGLKWGVDVEALESTVSTNSSNISTNTTDITNINELQLNTINSSNHTLVLSDAGKLIEVSSASAQTVTIPPYSSVAFPIGTQILVTQLGNGQVSIAPGAGVTLNSKDGNRKLSATHCGVTLIKTRTDTWVAFGDLTA